MFHVADELRIRNCCSICGREHIPEQEFCKSVAATSVSGVPGGKRLERKYTSRELVSQFIEVLPIVFTAESKRMLSMYPGKLVNKLERVVIDLEGTIIGIAYCSG